MKIKVLHNYKSPGNLENPIELLRGDMLELGETTDPNGSYPDWVYCKCIRTSRAGWVAAGVVKPNGDGTGVALSDYTSREMTVTAGDILNAEYELNGWYWCTRPENGETGWVALDNTEKSGEQ